jgi:hypothetical protein
MGAHREAYEEMAERHLREWKEDTRVRRRFWVRTALLCWACAMPGFLLGAWAFRVNDPELGAILLKAGTILVPIALLVVIGRAIHVAQDRGWL